MGLGTITCEEASRLISETMDHEPPFWERINLKFHLMMCKVCQTYMRQLHLLRGLVKSWADGVGRFLTDKGLSRESKEKMKQHLRQLKP